MSRSEYQDISRKNIRVSENQGGNFVQPDTLVSGYTTHWYSDNLISLLTKEQIER